MHQRTCSVEGCERVHNARGLCQFHYLRWWKGYPLDAPSRFDPKFCGIAGCGRQHRDSGLCEMHGARLRRRGTTEDPPPARGRKQSAEWVAKRLASTAANLATQRRECGHCGDGYQPTEINQRYCSGRCADTVARGIRLRYSRAHRIANPEYHADKRLRSLFGITLVEYEAMRTAQGDLCKICRQPETQKRKLSVDHDHDTGRVRGLLCTKCNQKLGIYEKNRASFEAYLQGGNQSLPPSWIPAQH